MEPQFDLVIPFLSMYPKVVKSAYCNNTTTSMCIADELIIAKLYNQPRCSSTDEWIKKLWYIYTMEYYLSIKKNEIIAFAGKLMELENSMLIGISTSHKSKGQMISLISG